jgi:hypothetical protein
VVTTTDTRTYRSLFAIREFRVLFLNFCGVVISVAASGLALATITYDATRSAVLSGLAMFGVRRGHRPATPACLGHPLILGHLR